MRKKLRTVLRHVHSVIFQELLIGFSQHNWQKVNWQGSNQSFKLIHENLSFQRLLQQFIRFSGPTDPIKHLRVGYSPDFIFLRSSIHAPSDRLTTGLLRAQPSTLTNINKHVNLYMLDLTPSSVSRDSKCTLWLEIRAWDGQHQPARFPVTTTFLSRMYIHLYPPFTLADVPE